MKVLIKRGISLVLVLTLVLSLSITAFAGLGVPTSTWNLKTKGKYTFQGEASRSNLYTDYLFTGTTKVEIKVVNKSSSDSVTVKLFEKSAWFFCETKATVPAKGTTTWKYSDLESDEKYYLQFYAPSNFEGYIRAY